MDIYEYAETTNADYYDFSTGYIYKVQDYNKAKKLGLPTPGIEVVDIFGNHVGYARNVNKSKD